MTLRARARLARAAASVVTVAALIAACGGQPDPDQGAQAPVSPTATTPQTSAAKPSAENAPRTPEATVGGTRAAPTPTPARGHGVPLCASSDLSLSLGDAEGAAGTVWRALRFTNSGDASCRMQGFPGVSYVAGDDGHQVGAAAYREGTKGASVTLRPGDVAYAAVGFVQVGNYDPDKCRPTDVRGLRVYPPQETKSMYLPNPGTGCANESLPESHLKVQTIRAGAGPG